MKCVNVYGVLGVMSVVIALPVQAQEVIPSPTPFVIQQETAVEIGLPQTASNNEVIVQEVTQENTIVTTNDEIADLNVDQSSQATIINPQVNTGTIINNVEQRNTVLVNPTPSPTPTPTPAPSPTPKILPNEELNFQITDNRTVTHIGEELTYRIIMRNFSERDINEATIKVFIPEFLIPSLASDNALEDPAQRLIYWRDVTISADSEVTLFVKAKVQPEAQPGVTLFTVAEINGPGVNAGAEDATSVEGQRVGQIDPQAAISYQPVANTAKQVDVPITAATGSEAGILSIISLISGAIIEIFRRQLSI